MCEPVRDVFGKPAIEDFNREDTYFTYIPDDGASKEICEDGGQNVLKISNISEGSFFMYIECGELDEAPRYFAMSSRFEDPFSLSVVAFVALDNGGWAQCYPRVYENTEYKSENLYELPENMDIKDPEIVLYANELNSEGMDFYIRRISLIKERACYGYMSGTSMAAPAVTGEIAVLASEWPGDSVGRITARVIGSTADCEELRGTTRTDGIVNVRKALDCEYSPVVDNAWIDDEGIINVSGYFFGEQGSVIVEDSEGVVDGLTVKEWNGQSEHEWKEDGLNTKDVIKINPAEYRYNGDELLVTVVTAKGRTGSRILTASNADDEENNKSFYEELTLPVDDKDFMRTNFYGSAALDGVIYYAGLENGEDHERKPVLWKCVLPKEGNEAKWEKTDHGVKATGISNICAWNRKLAYVENTSIKLYAPDEGSVYASAISLPEVPDDEYISSVSLINAAGALYFIMSTQKFDEETGKYKPYKTGLYSVDFVKHTWNRVYTLKTYKYDPVINVLESENGDILTFDFVGENSANSVSVETVTVKADDISSTVKEVRLPDDCRCDYYKLTGAANQYGIVLTGPADYEGITDNFFYSLSDDTVIRCKRQIAPGYPTYIQTTEYMGRTYFLGLDMYSKVARTFAYCDDEEFRGSSEHRDPLPCYGDEETGETGKLSTEISLTAADDGRVTVGKSIKVIPETVKKDGSTVPVSWMFYSENATIASVDQKGSVTGKTKGSTYIHAVGTDADGNGYEGKCEVNVYSKITGIKLSDTRLSVVPGSSFSLTAKVTPSDADFSAIEWSVSVPEGYPGAAYKTNEGTNEEGSFVDIMTDSDIKDKLQVTVTAATTDGSNKKASCVVTIGKAVNGITLKNGSRELDDKDVIPLNEGKTVSLKAVITPADASNKSVVWSSKDTSVAVVDKNGKVKATGYGICEIIASAADGSGVSRSCIIEVSAPVKSAELSESGTITLGVGMTHEISLARIIPYKCSPYTVEWKSSDEASVEVEGDPLDANWAVITAKKEGNAKITAEITNEGTNKKITKTLKVNVAQSQLSAGVVRIFNGKTDISESGLSENRLPVGKKLTLKANAYEKSKDEKALNSGKVKIVWDSSDPNTATVNNGKLTAY
ncbi:MAG: Ig-like domain-containing protein, partial [Lachnospiraceae bacterium]|nr:Ig-like domain-containing protein [Lachnospiraceae bacterium]